MIRYIKDGKAVPTTLVDLAASVRIIAQMGSVKGDTLPELYRLLRGTPGRTSGPAAFYKCRAADVTDLLTLHVRTGEMRIMCREGDDESKVELAFVLANSQSELPPVDQELTIRIQSCMGSQPDLRRLLTVANIVKSLREDGGEEFDLSALGAALNELIASRKLAMVVAEPSSAEDVQLFLKCPEFSWQQ